MGQPLHESSLTGKKCKEKHRKQSIIHYHVGKVCSIQVVASMELTSLNGSFTRLSDSVRKERQQIVSSVGRLSSGVRIQRASDDISSLSIATRLNTRTTSLRSVLLNLAQADSFIQVADNALGEVETILQRMNQLTVMANGGSITSQERAFLDQEFQQLREEIDRLLGSTTFNEVKVFGGIQGIAEDTTVAEAETGPVGSLADIVGLSTGTYDLDTGNEQFTGYVENDGTDSWLLVGRGRENWEFDGDGQGNRDDVITGLGTSAAFNPAAYDPSIINDLIQNAGLDLTDVEIRIKRAANTTGTEYQEARWRPISQTSWTWDFDGTNYAVEHEVAASSLGAAFSDADSRTRDTLSTPGPDTGNNYQRIWTFNWGGKGNIPGFSYGAAVAGTNGNDPNTFLWENTAENHATPYAEVYIRLRNPAAATAPVAPTTAGDLSDLSGLSIWLDGADLDGDSVSEGAAEAGVSGGAVTDWVNKAGGGSAVQGAAGSRPGYTLSAMNGGAVISFDGVNDWLGLTINTPETDYTEFVVYSSTDANGAFTTITSPVANNAGSHDRQFGLSGGRLYNRLWSTEIITSAGTYNDGQGHIASITVNSASGQTIEADSTQVAAGVKTSSNFNWDQGMVIGGHSLLGPYQGDIAEVIMFDRVLTGEEYEIVEGYLAHKWGLTGNLPANHAYKNVSPFASALDAAEFEVSEGAPVDTEVGDISADHPEDSTYQLTEGNDDGIFALDFNTGVLTIADNTLLDYETTQSYALTATITAVDGSVQTQEITVTITDVDESRVTFQVGADAVQQFELSVAKLDTTILFDEQSPDVRTREHAEAAHVIIQQALDRVTSRRAYYGSKQSSVDILASANQHELRNQVEAHSVMADTDIARTSSEYALQIARSEASIAIAAQTNQLRENVVLGIVEEGIQL